MGSGGGGKRAKAEKAGARLVGEEEFLGLLRGEEPSAEKENAHG